MYNRFNKGMIEVITGPMFSGKTEELLRRFRLLNYAKAKTLLIKPAFDTRFSKEEIISRAGVKTKTHSVKNTEQIRKILEKEKFDALVIDEIHFFDFDIVYLIEELANSGYHIIVSGLDQNFKREPFEVVSYLLSIAEKVTKLQAICVKCQRAATTTFRKVESKEIKLLGDVDEYEARCRKCHIQGSKDKN
ncbi:THYMIDINE KINASE [Mycoplasmopsis pulmonis]|uniref:Thymidine kinase n=1 Tax=Mycoplasmopsis pulmonis (strain UAB CTIP) TaxID=272635 RepID=Q98R65_MYCPU|nr:thymidine kinase [Mycoplasmopsis pulmonis]MDZ7293114.1 thymidine kinase [Mycoplasmopsis pulmonis]CAC13318.1 THYMIDINE KINASE [Mycoplasmopsis pulmonis]VEU67910.1 thymidine kinase [Mycoplasmopsis pulmonis]